MASGRWMTATTAVVALTAATVLACSPSRSSAATATDWCAPTPIAQYDPSCTKIPAQLTATLSAGGQTANMVAGSFDASGAPAPECAARARCGYSTQEPWIRARGMQSVETRLGERATVHGMLLNATTGVPLAGATIWIYAMRDAPNISKDTLLGTVPTDASGGFSYRLPRSDSEEVLIQPAAPPEEVDPFVLTDPRVAALSTVDPSTLSARVEHVVNVRRKKYSATVALSGRVRPVRGAARHVWVQVEAHAAGVPGWQSIPTLAITNSAGRWALSIPVSKIVLPGRIRTTSQRIEFRALVGVDELSSGPIFQANLPYSIVASDTEPTVQTRVLTVPYPKWLSAMYP